MKQNKSIIDRYFDYMRDSWCEEECRTIFGTRAASVWKVWCRSIAPDLCGRTRRFYVALDRGNRRLLIEHIACAVRGQDEECLSKEPSVLVCERCGSREIQMMAWVDPNTSECTSTIDADSDDRWCDTCQEHVWFCSLAEFRQRLDAWWESTDHSKKEEITGLCRTDFPAGDDCRAFVEACNAWWREHDYEGRRALWMEYDDSRVAANKSIFFNR